MPARGPCEGGYAVVTARWGGCVKCVLSVAAWFSSKVIVALFHPLGMSALRGYRGASPTACEFSTWNQGIGSADADLLGDLSTLVARNRDLARNNGVAAGILQTHVDNIVGTCLRLAAKPDPRAFGRSKEWADEWARGVEARWRVHAEGIASLFGDDCDKYIAGRTA